MKKITKEMVEQASLDEQLELAKTWRPRALAYLRAYSQYEQIRRRVNIQWALETTGWIVLWIGIWWANNH